MNDTVQESALAVGDWAVVLGSKDPDLRAAWQMEGEFVKITSIEFSGPAGETILTHVKLDGFFVYFFEEELKKVPESEVPSEIKARALWGSRIGVYYIYKPTQPLLPNTHACFFVGCENLATHEVMFNTWGTVILVYGCQSCRTKNHGVLCDGRDIKSLIPGYKGRSDVFESEQGKDLSRLFGLAGLR